MGKRSFADRFWNGTSSGMKPDAFFRTAHGRFLPGGIRETDSQSLRIPLAAFSMINSHNHIAQSIHGMIVQFQWFFPGISC